MIKVKVNDDFRVFFFHVVVVVVVIINFTWKLS